MPVIACARYRQSTGTAMRLLLVEDDHRTADYIVKGLTEAGHVCDLLRNGHDALFAATSGSYDVIIADRMIPDLDGLSMIKAVRAAGVRTPDRKSTRLNS